MRTTAGRYTIVTQRRQEIGPNDWQGVFLGVDGDRWVAGRMFNGQSRDDGFSESGEWWSGSHYTLANGTTNMLKALERYVKLSEDALVWDRIFEQRAAESIARFLAGPPRDDLPKLAAGWQESDAGGHRAPARGTTILLPFHEAKQQLFWFLHSTRLGAKEHLTEGVTLDRHQAYELVKHTTGPVRFELGYNTYWLAGAEPGR